MLPALLPDTPGLLRRTGGLLNALRGIQQEASAEYWYKLAMTLGSDSVIRGAYLSKSESLLRYEMATIRRNLENNKGQYEYQYYDSDGYGGACGPFYDIDANTWYEANRDRFDRLFECFQLLVELGDSPSTKADTWVELAEILKADGLLMNDGFSHLAREYYRNSFTCENRLETLLSERQLSNTWSNGWDPFNYGAILNLEQTIQKFPDYPGSYYSRALEKSREGKYKDALEDLNKYVALNGDTDTQFYRKRGWLYHQLGNTFSARQDAENILRLGGKLGDFLNGDWKDPDEAPF